MRFTNKCLCMCGVAWMCVGMPVHAHPVTVDGAIESAKQKKSQPAVAKSDPLPTALLPNPGAPASAPGHHPPKLWSIKGINGKYTAEIIWNQKIFHVPLVVGERFQTWEITQFDDDSVTLSEKRPARSKPKAASSKQPEPRQPLRLFVAASGDTISTYQIAADNEINTMQRRAAADLPAPTAPVARN
jgi:hypothetical protein